MARKLLFGLGILVLCIAPLMRGQKLVADDSTSTRLGIARVNVCSAAYNKILVANSRRPDTVSAEQRHNASREWLEAKLAASKIRADCIDASLEYLEREGVAIAGK